MHVFKQTCKFSSMVFNNNNSLFDNQERLSRNSVVCEKVVHGIE